MFKGAVSSAPILLEVNLGNQVSDLVVNKGDDIHQVALDFVTSHNLKETAVPPILEQILEKLGQSDEPSVSQKSSYVNEDITVDAPTISESEYILTADEIVDVQTTDSFSPVSAATSLPLKGDENTNKSLNRLPSQIKTLESSGEDMFNRLRDEWIDYKGVVGKDSGVKNRGDTMEHLSKNREMRMSSDPTSSFSSSHSAKKSVNIRLYENAVSRRRRIAQRDSGQTTSGIISVAKKMYPEKGKRTSTVTKKSSGHKHIGERLYLEGTLGTKQKFRDAKDAAASHALEEWSCSRCGSFYKTPLRESSVSKKCPGCGWDQLLCSKFKPVNIGLNLMPESGAGTIAFRRNSDNIHTVLHAECQEKKVKRIEQIGKHRNELKSIYSFHPRIPEESDNIVQKHIASPGSEEYNEKSLSGISNYLRQPVVDRLTSSTYKRTVPETAKHGKKIEAKDLSPFLNRLTYEYKLKEARREVARAENCTHDTDSKQPLFQPRPNPLANPEFLGANNKKGADTESFFEDFFLREKEQKLKKDRLIEATLNRESSALEKAKAVALPQSNTILDGATEKSIEEMFRLLVASSAHSDDMNRTDDKAAEMISKVSVSFSDVTNLTLDLAKIQLGLMIPEVNSLLIDVRNKYKELKASSKASTGPNDGHDEVGDKLVVNFGIFRNLVKKCLKLRNGVGRSYVYAPKKKPEVAHKMVMEERRALTFKPSLHTNPDLNLDRDRSIPIEDLLWREGKKTKLKIEASKKLWAKEEEKELTFKPKIYKPPRGVVPRYRAPTDSVPSVSQLKNREPRAIEYKNFAELNDLSPNTSPNKDRPEIRNKEQIEDSRSISTGGDLHSPSSTFAANIFYHPSAPPSLSKFPSDELRHIGQNETPIRTLDFSAGKSTKDTFEDHLVSN
jgi:hypothetical protein